MKALQAVLSVLTVAALWAEPSHAAPSEQSDGDVLITAVTDDPCCGSGIIAFAVGFSGRSAAGERSYFIPFMVAGQAKPGVGERCSIKWRWWQSRVFGWMLADGSHIWKGREVIDFRCRKVEAAVPHEREDSLRTTAVRSRSSLRPLTRDDAWLHARHVPGTWHVAGTRVSRPNGRELRISPPEAMIGRWR